MFRQIKNNAGQAVVGEYVLVVFLIVAVATAISVYFKRAVQARIRDATAVSGQLAREQAILVSGGQTQNLFVGSLYFQYEPYYVNTKSDVDQFSRSNDQLSESTGGRTTGIYTKQFNEQTGVHTISDVAPPDAGVGH